MPLTKALPVPVISVPIKLGPTTPVIFTIPGALTTKVELAGIFISPLNVAFPVISIFVFLYFCLMLHPHRLLIPLHFLLLNQIVHLFQALKLLKK